MHSPPIKLCYLVALLGLVILGLLAQRLSSNASTKILYTFDSTSVSVSGFGESVTLDDFTGDGVADVVIGAPYEPHGPCCIQSGRVYVFSGADGAPVAVLIPPPADDLAVSSFGESTTAGDVDGDGRSDIAIAGHDNSLGANSQPWRVYVFSGLTKELLFTLRSPDFSSGTTGTGAGLPLAMADFDGDGISDVIVGDLFVRRIYVYSGLTQTLISTMSSSQTGFAGTIAAGDLDADGKAEIAASANANFEDGSRVHVFTGGTGELRFKLLQGGGVQRSPLAIGDVDGDLQGDIVVGAPTEGGFGVYRGAVYVFSGRQIDSGTPPPLMYEFAEPEVEDQDFFGATVAVGDVDGDGRGDVLASGDYSHLASGQQGSVYAFSGATGKLLEVLEMPDVQADSARFGEALAAADIDGDGFAEVAVGAPWHTVDGTQIRGRVFIYARTGSTPPPSNSPSPSPEPRLSLIGFTAGSDFTSENACYKTIATFKNNTSEPIAYTATLSETATYTGFGNDLVPNPPDTRIDCTRIPGYSGSCLPSHFTGNLVQQAFTIGPGETKQICFDLAHNWEWIPPTDTIGTALKLIDYFGQFLLPGQNWIGVLNGIKDGATTVEEVVDLIVTRSEAAPYAKYSYSIDISGLQVPPSVQASRLIDAEVSSWKQGLYEGSVTAAVIEQLICLVPALPFAVGCGVALFSALDLYDRAYDPVEDYKQLPIPVPLPDEALSLLPDGPWREYGRHFLTAVSYQIAGGESFIRAAGATEAGDAHWEAAQLAHAREMIELAITEVTAAIALAQEGLVTEPPGSSLNGYGTDYVQLLGAFQAPSAGLAEVLAHFTFVQQQLNSTAADFLFALSHEQAIYQAINRASIQATFVVTTTADTDDGVCDTDCSLREAIDAANTLKGRDAIVFDIPMEGTPTIVPLGPLPTITDPVEIDGTTQGNGLGRVELDGSQAGESCEYALSVTAGQSRISGLVINRFANAAIRLADGGGNVLVGNLLGTDVKGEVAMGNYWGVLVYNSPDNVIGGTSEGTRNVISGNTFGIEITGPLATGNRVLGNYIGTDQSGTTAVGNEWDGVVIVAANENFIGRTEPGSGNVISGNGGPVLGNGILLQGATGNLVQGNFIGTDVTGNVALGNTGRGITYSFSSGNQFGGSSASARNVIAGNPDGGIVGSSDGGDVIQGNYVGIDASGMLSLPNGRAGISIGGDGQIVGGVGVGEGNLVSGNNGPGIIIGVGSNNVVEGNRIGLAGDGFSPLGNHGDGILVDFVTSDTRIGGPILGEANTIAFNEGHGVHVDATNGPALQASIRGNSIYSNGGFAIKLSNGGNNGTAPPTLSNAEPLSGGACSSCIVDLYSDQDDEGRVYHGFAVADAVGIWTFSGVVSGPRLSATSTDLSGNTSEFSAPLSLCDDLDADFLCDAVDSDDDNDAVLDGADNCPTVPNAGGQGDDVDGDLAGDACDGPGSGNVDCSGPLNGVSAIDALKVLRFSAGLSVSQSEPCLNIGLPRLLAPPDDWKMGDVDCSGAVNSIDALKILRANAGLSVVEPAECPEVRPPP